MTSDISKAELEERVAELEAIVAEMAPDQSEMSRRDVVKLAGAGAAGLAGGALASDDAQAASTQVGTYGSPGNPIDVIAEDVYGPGGQGSGDPVNFESLNAGELSGGLTSGSTIDTLDGLGLEFVNNTLKTTGTPGAVAEIENDELSGTAFDAEKLIFRKEFFLTYQSFVDKVEIGLDDVVYDRSSNTIGDGTPDGDFSSVSTGSLNGGGPLSDGDGTERQIWVIANGASDPANADAEDIILEKES